MGSVWVAHHKQLGVPVAIKLMMPSSSKARERFEREAKAAARLRSPHVVDVNDYGFEGDTPYIVMELLDGEDLGARLKRERRISLRAAAAIATQVAKALRRAHDAGMVHRDLKPSNIFIERDDGDEIVKILDFGVVKEISPSQAYERTKTGVLVGTAQYMSPEQASACPDIDHRSDLWSLGVILFRAITGCLPFSGATLYMIIKNIIAGSTPVPSHYASDLSPEVDAFFERALARDVSKRFQSASEMAAAFERLSSARPADSITTPWGPAHSIPISLSSSEVMTVSSVELDWDDLTELSTVSTSELAPTSPIRRDPPRAAAAEVSEPHPSSMRAGVQSRPIFSNPWMILAGSLVTFLTVICGIVGLQSRARAEVLELPPVVLVIALPREPPPAEGSGRQRVQDKSLLRDPAKATNGRSLPSTGGSQGRPPAPEPIGKSQRDPSSVQ
jgi:serine/threonine-protein kinase